MVRKILGYLLQFIGSLFFLLMIFFIVGLVSSLRLSRYDHALHSIVWCGVMWGLGYLFYAIGRKVLTYEGTIKTPLSFHLDSPFKRVMFIVSILSLIGIVFSFIAYGPDIDRVIRYVFQRRFTSFNFENLLMRISFYLFPVSVFLMMFGERLLSWIKNGSTPKA